MSSLAAEIQSNRTKAAAQWREIVHEAAAGNEPSLAALTKIAESLGIPVAESLEKLQIDAGVVRQHDWHLAERDAANSRVEAALAPYNGSEREFRAAVEEAESNARALRAAHSALVRQTQVAAGTAEGNRRRIEGSRPDLFTKPAVNG